MLWVDTSSPLWNECVSERLGEKRRALWRLCDVYACGKRLEDFIDWLYDGRLLHQHQSQAPQTKRRRPPRVDGDGWARRHHPSPAPPPLHIKVGADFGPHPFSAEFQFSLYILEWCNTVFCTFNSLLLLLLKLTLLTTRAEKKWMYYPLEEDKGGPEFHFILFKCLYVWM